MGFWGLDNGYHKQGSFYCTQKQKEYYETCGCPEPEPHKDACTLCYDGAPVSAEYINNTIYSYGFFGGKTCGDAEKSVPWRYEKDEYLCREVDNKDAALYCGCVSVPTQEPTEAPTSKGLLIHVELIVFILTIGVQNFVQYFFL